MYSPSHSADIDVAAQCFLNALLRETPDWRYVPDAPTDQKQHILLPLSLSLSQSVCLPLKYYSSTQHHQHRFSALLISHDSLHGISFSFETLVSLVLSKPAIHAELSSNITGLFKQRVLESHANTWQAIDLRHHRSDLRQHPLTLPEAEQALLVGLACSAHSQSSPSGRTLRAGNHSWP